MFLLQHLTVDSQSGWVGRVCIACFLNHYSHTTNNTQTAYLLFARTAVSVFTHSFISLPESHINNPAIHSSLHQNQYLTRTGPAITW